MGSLSADLRAAARGLAHRRVVTALAIAILAIGTGATTGIFSIVDAVLLRPLPYHDPSRLYQVWQAFPEWASIDVLKSRWDHVGISYPQYAGLREMPAIVENATIYLANSATLNAGGGAETGTVAFTTATWLPTLGISPSLGRGFTAADEEGAGADAAMLSYDFWHRLGADGGIIGRQVRVDGRPYDIVGVMPPELRMLTRAALGGPYVKPDVWLPIGSASSRATGGFGHSYQAIVRLRDGTEAPAASAAIVARLRSAYAVYRPQAKTPPGGSLEPLGQYDTRNARASLWLLLAGAVVVLLVACGNVGNLMLSQVAARTRELATRAALGASRLALVRLIVIESLLIACAGGVLALGVAFWIVNGLRGIAPPDVPNIDAVRLDLRVLLFSLSATAGAGLLAGLAPGWLAGRGSLVDGLAASRVTTGEAGRRVQKLLSIGQVAFATTALTLSGLLVHSIVKLAQTDPGFQPQGLLTFGIDLPQDRYASGAARAAFFADLRGRLSAVPGVSAVTQTSSLPFRPAMFTSNPVTAETRTGARTAEIERRIVQPNFFDVVGIGLVDGQLLSERTGDRCEMVVSRATARKLWPEGGVLGSRVTQFNNKDGPACEVVGVVGDIRERVLGADPLPTFYMSAARNSPSNVGFVLRTEVEAESLVPAVRAIVRGMDPELPVRDPATMAALIDRTLVEDRYRTIPLALFAAAALLLAAVGTFGVTSHVVARERRALAIRLALGAGASQALALVMRDAVAVAAIGTLAGSAGGFALSSVIRSFLFGVAPNDPATYAAAAGTVVVLVVAAAWLPARRATRLDPAQVLRAE